MFNNEVLTAKTLRLIPIEIVVSYINKRSLRKKNVLPQLTKRTSHLFCSYKNINV